MATMLKSKYRKTESEPVKPLFQEYVQTPILETTMKRVKIPRALDILWTQFVQPPFRWSSIGAYLRMKRCLIDENEPIPQRIVKTLDDWCKYPDSILRPDESQIERLTTDPIPVVAKPAVKSNAPRKTTFIEWQRTDPVFSQLGVNSLKK